MLTTLRARAQREEGFTLIELLVVILIIGILAAIAIPSFLNQKGKGEDTAAKSNARAAATALETYYTDNSNYSCGTSAECVTKLRAIEPELPASGLTITQGAATYTVAAASSPSGRTFSVQKTSTGTTRPCSVPANTNAGGCKNPDANGAGTW